MEKMIAQIQNDIGLIESPLYSIARLHSHSLSTILLQPQISILTGSATQGWNYNHVAPIKTMLLWEPSSNIHILFKSFMHLKTLSSMLYLC